jgi:hypothetical protein
MWFAWVMMLAGARNLKVSWLAVNHKMTCLTPTDVPADADEKVDKRNNNINSNIVLPWNSSAFMDNSSGEKVLLMRSRSDGSIETARSEETHLSTQSLPENASAERDRHVNLLLEEKKNLHAYLKAYER